MTKQQPAFAVFLIACTSLIALIAGCNGSGTTDSFVFTAPSTGPQLIAAQFVDVDGNGVDENDILVLTFDGAVEVHSSSATAFEFASTFDTLGSGATMTQSVYGSSKVEVTLGSGVSFFENTSSLDVVAAGSLTVRDLSGQPARAVEAVVTIASFTSTAPTLISIEYNDANLNDVVDEGDFLLAEFDKPITIPGGATVAENFALAVTGDLFGGGATLSAYRGEAFNRGALITLGSSPVITVSGTYDATVITAGSPSNIEVQTAGMTIVDSLSSGANTIVGDTSLDLALLSSVKLRFGQSASVVLGNVDATNGGVTSQGLYQPEGLYHYAGNITIGVQTFAIDVAFVADTSNNRVIIFDGKPTGNNADADVVLGQASFGLNLPNRSADLNPAAAADTLWAPVDVHFQASSNQLFVSDTGNNRILIWDDVLNSADGSVSLTDGVAADWVVGQSSFADNDANQGFLGATSRTLSMPGGLHAAGGQLAIADTGNNRVLLFSTIPSANNEAASTVLGQSNFISRLANSGGVTGLTMNAPEDVLIDPLLRVFGQNGAVLVADTGNNRVLLWGTSSPANGVSADMVYGQANLTSAVSAAGATGLSGPTGVTALDGVGGGVTARVWVADKANHRVVVYSYNPDTAQGATTTEPQDGDSGVHIGQALAADNTENRGNANFAATANSFANPTRLCVTGSAESNLLVADKDNHRILDFTTPPIVDGSANIVHGQSSFAVSWSNGHFSHEPIDLAVSGTQMLVADSKNNRVLLYNAIPTSAAATSNVVLGQDNLNQTLANRGGSATADSLSGPQAVVTDGVRIVVADTDNNRVLIYSTLGTVTDGASAGTALGQPNVVSSLPNGGGVSAARMDSPAGLAISGTRLIVCDRDNNRVLIFNDLTAAATGAAANVVIGQDDFTSIAPNGGSDVNDDTLFEPTAVAVIGSALYIVDQGNHRILGYTAIPTSNGVSADFVLGQENFTTRTTGTGSSRLNTPTNVTADGTRLVVSDGGNNRVLIFSSVLTSFASAQVVIGQSNAGSVDINQGGANPSDASLHTPGGVFFNGLDLWITDSKNGRLLRFR